VYVVVIEGPKATPLAPNVLITQVRFNIDKAPKQISLGALLMSLLPAFTVLLE
jgi:hypothetical protein